MTSPARPLTWLARLGVVLLVGLPLLRLVLQGLEVQPDTARDLMLAAECLGPDGCLSRGAPASLEPLYQGGLWIAHLAALQRLGLGAGAAQIVSAVVYVSAALCIGIAAERLFGRLTGLLAVTCLVLWPTALSTEIATQWNPSLISLPAAVLTIACVRAVGSGTVGPWLLAALALSMLVQLHLVCLVLLPCVALLFVCFPPYRPLRAALLCLAMLLSPLALLSRDALWPAWLALTQGTSSAQQVKDMGTLHLLFVLGVPAMAALVWLSPWTRSAARSPAVWALMSTSLAPMLALALGLWLVDQEAKFYYFAPFRAGAALLAAWWLGAGLHGLTRRRPRLSVAASRETTQTWSGLATLACTLPLLWPQPRPPDALTFSDIERLQATLSTVGVCTIQDWWRLQGPVPYSVFVGLQALASRPHRCDRRAGPWMLWRDDANRGDPLPPGARTVALDAGDRLVLAPGQPALDWQNATIQAQLLEGAAEGKRPLLQDGGLAPRPGYPHVLASRLDRPWRRVTVRWPLHVDAKQALVLQPCSSQLGAHVVVSALRTAGASARQRPDGSVLVTPEAQARDAWLDVEWRNLGSSHVNWLPGLLVLSRDQAALGQRIQARTACR